MKHGVGEIIHVWKGATCIYLFTENRVRSEPPSPSKTKLSLGPPTPNEKKKSRSAYTYLSAIYIYYWDKNTQLYFNVADDFTTGINRRIVQITASFNCCYRSSIRIFSTTVQIYILSKHKNLTLVCVVHFFFRWAWYP